MTHHPHYRGLFSVTVACHCGWVSEGHRSRGRARHAYNHHIHTSWLSALLARLDNSL